MPETSQKNTAVEKINIDLIAHPDIVNPFTEITRRARKFLLLTSFVGFTVTWAGFVPNQIETLGITLTEMNKNAILILIIFSLLYFISAFWLYANTDLIRYKILRRAGTDNIKNTSGKKLLESREAIKKYEKELQRSKPTKTNNLSYRLPRPPSEIFTAASVKEQIEEPMQLYKYSNAKVIFDKFVPIIGGMTCLTFITFKLLLTKFSDTHLVYISTIFVFTTFALFAMIFNFTRFKKHLSNSKDKLINFYNITNSKFILLQQKIHKPGSKRHQKLDALRKSLAQKAIDNMLKRQKKEMKRYQNKKKMDS